MTRDEILAKHADGSLYEKEEMRVGRQYCLPRIETMMHGVWCIVRWTDTDTELRYVDGTSERAHVTEQVDWDNSFSVVGAVQARRNDTKAAQSITPPNKGTP